MKNETRATKTRDGSNQTQHTPLTRVPGGDPAGGLRRPKTGSPVSADVPRGNNYRTVADIQCGPFTVRVTHVSVYFIREKKGKTNKYVQGSSEVIPSGEQCVQFGPLIELFF